MSRATRRCAACRGCLREVAGLQKAVSKAGDERLNRGTEPTGARRIAMNVQGQGDRDHRRTGGAGAVRRTLERRSRTWASTASAWSRRSSPSRRPSTSRCRSTPTTRRTAISTSPPSRAIVARGRGAGGRAARRMKRVVITGAGTINALGHDVPATLEAMREGALRHRPAARSATSSGCRSGSAGRSRTTTRGRISTASSWRSTTASPSSR